MPHVAVAGGHLLDACSAVVDGEVQLHHGIATRRIGERVSGSVIIFGISDAINPGETIACGHGFGACSAVFDGEVQSHHRIATRRVGKRVGGSVIVFGIGDAINPSELFAGVPFIDARGRHVHRDGEGRFGCGGTGDIIGGQSGSGRHTVVGGCCRINGNGFAGLIVPSIGHITVVAIDRSGEFRAFTLADGLITADRYGASIRLEDGQMQRHYTVHAARGLICFRVVAAFGVGLAFPCVRVASRLVNVMGYGGYYREVQRDGGVAAVGGDEFLRVVARFLVRDAVPFVAVGSANGEFVENALPLSFVAYFHARYSVTTSVAVFDGNDVFFRFKFVKNGRILER